MAGSNSSKNPYQVLGLDNAASDVDVAKAYRKGLVNVHPDRDATLTDGQRKDNAEIREQLLEAQRVLSNKRLRSNLDENLRSARGPTTGESNRPAPEAPRPDQHKSQSLGSAPVTSRPDQHKQSRRTPVTQLALSRLRSKYIYRERDFEEPRAPSHFRFAVAQVWAGGADITDVAATPVALTGIGTVGLFVLEILVFDIPIYWLIGGASQRQNHNIVEKASEGIDALQIAIKSLRNRYATFLRLSRKSRLLRKPVTAAASRFAAARSRVMKSKAGKRLGRMALDKIPIIEWLPFRSMLVFGARKDAKEAYETAKEAKKEYFKTLELYRELQAATQEAQFEALAEEEIAA